METELKILEPELKYSEHNYTVVIEHCDIKYTFGVTVYSNQKLKAVTDIYRVDMHPLKNSVKKKMKKMIQELFVN